MAPKDQRDDPTVPAWSSPARRRDTPAGPGARPTGAPDRHAPGARTLGPDGRYQVLSQIGKGGFGTVYRAYDHRLEKFVAIKVLNTRDISPLELKEYVRRFDAEAKAAAQLEHPGVVAVLDYDPYADEPYLVMPFLEFGTLRDWLTEHPRMTWPEALDLGTQVAEALHYAHTHGIQAHRDVKPGNIFYSPGGRYKVGDFGIARRQRLGGGATRSIFFSAGTPRYMAPEQILTPGSVDARTDLFALCVVLYEVLTGRLPFRGVSLDFDPEEDATAAQKIVDAAFEPPRQVRKLVPDVPAEFARAIERGLQKDARDRFTDCGAFAISLKQIQGQVSQQRKPHRPWLAPAALAVVLVGYAVWFWPQIRQWVPRRDTVAEARREAAEAKAPDLAPEAWQQAEKQQAQAAALDSPVYRDEAVRLYALAAVQAWLQRLRQAEATAEKLLAKEHAPAPYGRAENAWHAAEPLARRIDQQLQRGDPGAASEAAELVASLRGALADYQQAAAEASQRARPALVNQLDAAAQSLEALRARAATEQQPQVEKLAALIDGARTALGTDDLVTVQDRLDEIARLTTSLDSAALKLARNRAADAYRSALQQRVSRAKVPPERVADWEEAERLYRSATAKLEEADRSADVAVARSATELFEQATAKYTELNARIKAPDVDLDAVQVQLAAAEAARGDADAVGAPLLPRARDRYQQAERALAEARAHVATDPRRAAEEVKSAAAGFRAAQTVAEEDRRRILGEVSTKRGAALRAQEQADAAGALRDPGAAEAYRLGRAALERAEEINDSATASLAVRLAGYNEAIDRFDEARRLAAAPPPLEPARPAAPPAPRPAEPAPPALAVAPAPIQPGAPFDLRLEPRADGIVVVQSGVPAQFWARTNARDVSYRWSVDGEPMRQAEDAPGLELVTYREGLHKVQVTASDRSGRQVTREWTVRVQAAALE